MSEDAPSYKTSSASQSAGAAMDARTMPRNLDAERGVICSCLLMPDCIDELMPYPPELFYHPPHVKLFEVLRDMRLRAVPVDFITLIGEINRTADDAQTPAEKLTADTAAVAACGGAAYISELFTFVTTAGNFAYYVDLLREAWMCRRMIAVGTRIAARGYAYAGQGEDIETELSAAESEIFGLRDQRKIDADLKDGKQIAIELMTAVETAARHKGGTVGIPSGFHDIDRMMGGWRDQELYVIAARPSQGKSAFALNTLRTALFGLGDGRFAGVPVGLFSLEMPAVDQAKRLASDMESIELQKFRDGFFGRQDMNRIRGFLVRLGESRVYIDDTPNISVQAWRVKARRMVSKHGVKIIFVDYLQLMRSESRRARDNRQAEVAEISTMLKCTARELNIPVVALAQLTRDAENRLPNLSQLRESGQIEQDADGVIFLYRPDKGKKDEDGKPLVREESLAIVAKQRNGPVGDVDLDFLGQFTRFENVTEKRYSNNKEKRQGSRRKAKATSEEYMEDPE